ncbi:MAG: beta-galactosidase trimerization domain-containing protein [Victivallales bacterium]|nr:beta-galactosidase trimerization domain-containing protein [Victivallales bacterium]
MDTSHDQNHLRFRQIHLDFHTGSLIPGIGLAFDKEKWQKTLQDAHVNSITLFAKCHHGWHYHNTAVGHMHPNLGFDLLRAQYEACREVDINAPIYLSAGYDVKCLQEHPEWQTVPYVAEGETPAVNNNIRPGFLRACFNSPYVEHLVEEIREVLEQFPDCNGIFLDIVSQPLCICEHCLKVMRENGLDPMKPQDLGICARMALDRYYSMTTHAIMDVNPNMPVFHNAGITPGCFSQMRPWDSHLELESLPTGGWGYDHFPMSAKYAITTGFDFLGMTGKFHTTWGEFGGFKSPNALRYECDAMLAFGAKCSIGDQLHPSGALDEATYHLVGQAYADVEAKEPWCDNVSSVAEIAILPKTAFHPAFMREEQYYGDVGANRVLLEGHFLYDVIDLEADFTPYRLLILPDEIHVDAKLKRRLDSYLSKGGRLLLTGSSGLNKDGKPLFDLGATLEGASPFQPDYMLPIPELQVAGCESPVVMYLRGQRMKLVKGAGGRSLGDVYDPYFNRTDKAHFCSHQHTPNHRDASPYISGVQKDNIVYLAHPVFSIYRVWGNVPLGQYLRKVIGLALGRPPMVESNLPSMARLSVMNQSAENRLVVHLLYANVLPRGMAVGTVYDGVTVSGNGEVIEDLLPLHGTIIQMAVDKPVKGVTLEPQGVPVPFSVTEGRLSFRVDSFTCHQMVVVQF